MREREREREREKQKWNRKLVYLSLVSLSRLHGQMWMQKISSENVNRCVLDVSLFYNGGVGGMVDKHWLLSPAMR